MRRWKRGSSWVEEDPPVRVYRRRPVPNAAAGTANTGPDHRAAPALIDPPPPSSDQKLPFGAPPSPDSSRGGAPPSPANPAPPSLTRPSEHPPHHGALGSTAYPSPPPSQQTLEARRTDTPPSAPVRKATPASPSSKPTHGSATPPTSSAPARGGTPPPPSSEPAHGSAPPLPSSAPARQGTPPLPTSSASRRNTPPHHTSAPTSRGTPPLPSSTPNRGATPPSSGTGSPSGNMRTPSSGNVRTPSSGNARTPSPSHTGHFSSSSSGTASSGAAHVPGSSGSTASSSFTKSKSYASLLQPARKKNDDEKLRAQLFDFLNIFTVGSAKCPYYKAQVAAMKAEGNITMGIQFEHLLKHDKDIAIAICNKQERVHEFVHPVVCKFLFDEKLTDDRNEIAKKLQITFFSMPRSIKYVTEFVRENGGTLAVSVIVAGSITECIARDIGIMVVQRSAAEVFRAHAQGLTWDGDFDLTDIVVVNDDEIRITKPPMPGKPAEQTNDVHKIGSTFMPMFIHNGRMALYFSVLAADLRNANESEVNEDWFREYVLGHAALRPSPVRYNFIDGAHHTCKESGVAGSAIKMFLDALPLCYEDWRLLIPTDSSDPFFKVYQFRFEPTEGIADQFKATNGGLLSFKRHFSRHASIHFNKINDLTEVEMIGARKLEKALPYILKMLLKECHMHKRGPLLVHWRPYRDYRASRDGSCNMDGIIGVYPSFW